MSKKLFNKMKITNSNFRSFQGIDLDFFRFYQITLRIIKIVYLLSRLESMNIYVDYTKW
jgi:hypothetical protein